MEFLRNQEHQPSFRVGSSRLALFLIFLSLVLPEFSQGQLAEKTEYDGVTTNYNSYGKFEGNSGFKMEETYEDISQYTMTIWFKLDVEPWGDHRNDMSLITFAPDAFSIIASKNQFIDFKSEKSSSITIDADNILTGLWYIVVVQSSKSRYNLKIFNVANDLIGERTSTTFFPRGYSTLSFDTIYLGINDDERSDELIGSVRNLRVFSTADLTDAQIYNSQFFDLYPNIDIIVKLFITDDGRIYNQMGLGVGETVGQNREIPTVNDFMGSFWCWNPSDSEYLTFLDLTSVVLEEITLESSVYDENVVEEGTLQVWAKRMAGVTPQDEILFNHEDMLRLEFEERDYKNLLFTPREQSREEVTQEMRYNIWYYIQVATSATEYSFYITDPEGNTLQRISSESYSSAQSGSTDKIQIAEDFQGYIKGMKYFKTFISTQRAYDMEVEFDDDSNLMFYYLFVSLGYNSNSNEIANYGIFNFDQVQEIRSGTAEFYEVFIQDLNSNLVEGTVDQEAAFDGYTCMDDKKKPRLDDKKSYIRSQFYLDDQDTSLTVEFWMKSFSPEVGNFAHLTLAEERTQETQFFAIRQEQTDLNCYPAFQFKTSFVAYEAFSYSENGWQHVACSFDADERLIQGVFYARNKDYTYEAETPPVTIRLSSEDHILQMGMSPGRGATFAQDRIMYMEVRFWNQFMSAEDIQNNRFYQLNVTSQQQYLYSYMKLMGAFFVSDVAEIDFADPDLEREIEFSDISWYSDDDLLICPLGYFHLDDDDVCYRDGVGDIKFQVYKGATNYTVINYDLTFLSEFIQDNADEIYDRGWELIEVLTVLNTSDISNFQRGLEPQKNNDALVFTYSQVANNPGWYNISYDLRDKKHFQKVHKFPIELKTLDCLQLLINSQPEDAFIYVNLFTQMNNNDAEIRYQAQNCDDYSHQRSKMEINYILNNKIPERKLEVPKTTKKFLIEADMHQYFTFGEYQAILVQYEFRKSVSDVIVYNKRVLFRFVQDFVLGLIQTNDYIVAGETVLLSADGTEIINPYGEYTFNLDWICPGNLSIFCEGEQNNEVLRITYDTFNASDLNPFTWYELTLSATLNSPNFGITKNEQRTVEVVWVPFDTKAEIFGPQDPSPNLVNTYELVVYNPFGDDEIEFEWRIDPEVDASFFINSNNRWQFSLKENSLAYEAEYTISVELLYSSNKWSLWNGTYPILTTGLPTGGSLSISPSSGGVAYETAFTISTRAWKTDRPPMTYQFFYVDNDGKDVPLAPVGDLTSIETTLPSIETIKIVVYNNANASSSLNTSVSISTLQNFDEVLNMMATVDTEKMDYESISKSIIASTSLPQMVEANETQKALELSDTLIETVKFQTDNIDSLDQNATQREFLVEGATQVYVQCTNPGLKLFDQNNMQQIVDSMSSLIKKQQFELDSIDTEGTITQATYENTLFGSFKQDNDFNTDFVRIQSNIIQYVETIYEEGALEDERKNETEELIGKVRQLLIDYEAILSQMAYDGQEYNVDTDQLRLYITKQAKYNNELTDVAGNVSSPLRINQTSNDTIEYSFPLSKVSQPTDSQSLTVINYKSNPFLGSLKDNETLMSNNSIYFALRDKNGNELGPEYLNEPITITFPFIYDQYEIFPNITDCSYISGNDASTWENSSCNTTFDRENNKVGCSCLHMSTYSVIQLPLSRPFAYFVEVLTIPNWPSFVVLVYMIIILVFGVFYSITKDYQDHKNFTLDYHTGEDGVALNKASTVSINSVAAQRHAFYMTFANEFRFGILFRFFLADFHPILSLRFKHDLQVSRLMKFLVLYTRLVIVLGLSFMLFYDVQNFEEMEEEDNPGQWGAMVLLCSIIGSIFFIPMPIYLFYLCRTRYYLLQNSDKDVVALDNEDLAEKAAGPKIYVDPTIPIRLLFLFNSYPTSDLVKNFNTKTPYGAGAPWKLGSKLNQLYEDDILLQKEEEKEENERREEEKQAFSTVPAGQNVTQRNLMQQQKVPPEADPQLNVQKQGSDELLNEAKDISGTDFKTRARRGGSNTGISHLMVKGDDEEQKQQVSPLPFKAMDKSDIDLVERDPIQVDDIIMNYDSSQNEIQENDSDFNEGGESEEIEKEKKDGPHDSAEMEFDQQNPKDSHQRGTGDNRGGQISESEGTDDDSLNTEDFLNDKKELVAEQSIILRIIGAILLLGINIAIVFVVAQTYSEEEYYNEGYRYVWILVFFFSQILGFLVTDFIALAIMATSVFYCCSKNKRCMTLFIREGMVVYEDFRFVYNMMHAHD